MWVQELNGKKPETRWISGCVFKLILLVCVGYLTEKFFFLPIVGRVHVEHYLQSCQLGQCKTEVNLQVSLLRKKDNFQVMSK